MRFLKIYRKHQVKFIWVKGHAVNAENNLCDKLAVEASSKGRQLEDEGYIKEMESGQSFLDE
jgi:ribonuclease HI